MKNLRDNVAVVTGGAGCIGLAVARELSREGMRVALVDLRPERLEEAVAGFPGVVSAHAADVANEAAAQGVLHEVLSAHGGAQVLVNAAGVSVAGDFAETPLGDFRWLMDVNLGGTVNC